MTRPAPRNRVGLPCAAAGQRFLSRANAVAYAAHTDRPRDVQFCRYCLGWHAYKRTAEQRAQHQARAEAERKARVAAYLGTVPERGRER